jgi:hypothetical protein
MCWPVGSTSRLHQRTVIVAQCRHPSRDCSRCRGCGRRAPVGVGCRGGGRLESGGAVETSVANDPWAN